VTEGHGAIDHLLAECQRIEEFAQVNAGTHFILAERAGMWARLLGVIPVAIGGVLAAFVLSDPSTLTKDTAKWFAMAAIIAGVLSSILAYLNPGKSQTDHSLAGSRYKTLENEARRGHEVFAHEEGREAFALRVRELSRRYDELGESSPPTSDWAYRRANERAKAGVYSHRGPASD
jgi:uncharacterized membrane protein YhdT